MLFSAEDRARAWRDAISAEAAERDYNRHLLATVAFDVIGSTLALRGDAFVAAIKDSFDWLEHDDLIARDDLREAFEAIDGSRASARTFVDALGRVLRQLAATAGLSDTDRDRAEQLTEYWRVAAAES